MNDSIKKDRENPISVNQEFWNKRSLLLKSIYNKKKIELGAHKMN